MLSAPAADRGVATRSYAGSHAGPSSMDCAAVAGLPAGCSAPENKSTPLPAVPVRRFRPMYRQQLHARFTGGSPAVRPDSDCISSVAERLKSTGASPAEVGAVLGERVRGPPADLPFLALLMRTLCADGHWRTALAVFDAMPDIGVRRDNATTNAAIHACHVGGDNRRAVALFQSMPQWSVRRDSTSFCSAIAATAALGDWQLAAALFIELCDTGIPVIEPTCKSLITAADSAGQWPVAERMLLAMCARIPVFQVLRRHLSTASTTPLQPATRRLLDDLCERLSGRPSTHSVQNARLHRGDGSGVGRLQNCIAEDVLVSPRCADDALLHVSSCLASSSSMDTTLCCALQPAASGSPGTMGSKSRLQSCDSGGSTARPTARAARTAAAPPDCAPAIAAVWATPWTQHGAQQAAPALFGSNTPSTECCNAVLLAYANAAVPPWQRAVMLVNIMLLHPDSLRPDAKSFALALRALASAGRIKEAQQLMRDMHAAGVPDTPECVAAVVVAAAVAGQPDLAAAAWLRSALSVEGLHGSRMHDAAHGGTGHSKDGNVSAASNAAGVSPPGSQGGAAGPASHADAIAFHACTVQLLQDLLRLGNPGAAVSAARVLGMLPARQQVGEPRPPCQATMAPEPRLLALLLRAAGAARPLLGGIPLGLLASAPSARLRLLQANLETGGIMSDCINAI